MIITLSTRNRRGRHEVTLDLACEADDDAETLQVARDHAERLGLTASERMQVSGVAMTLSYRDEARAKALVVDLCALYRTGDPP